MHNKELQDWVSPALQECRDTKWDTLDGARSITRGCQNEHNYRCDSKFLVFACHRIHHYSFADAVLSRRILAFQKVVSKTTGPEP
jgi:hypothetical protein